MNNNQHNIKRAPYQHNAELKRIKKQQQKDRFLASMLLFLIAFAIITVILIICISCKHNHNASTTTTDEYITVDNGETNLPDDVSLSSYIINDVIYVNFTELSKKCNMTITGSKDEQTFSVKANDTIEYLTVKPNSNTFVINGETVNAPHIAVLKDNDIWLSLEFVSNSVNGVSVSYDTSSKILTCKRKELNASTKDNPLYEEVSFTYNITTPIETQNSTGLATGTVAPTTTGATPSTTTPTTDKPSVPSKYNFIANLSSYEKYMEPEDRDGYLIIANRDILLSADFVPKNLTKVYKAASSADKYKMTYEAAMAFEALVKEAAANGYTITPKSGYRSYNTQKYLFQNYVNGHIQNDNMTYAEAFAYASTYSMIEGASEHQTGLTMDVNELEQTFGATPEGKWLAANCHKFGFIIRYPKDKEAITGISWEPWHIRYVGRYHAEQMKSLNMCLEEYLVHINKMPTQ